MARRCSAFAAWYTTLLCMVPPKSGCGWQTTAASDGLATGTVQSKASSRPAGPAMKKLRWYVSAMKLPAHECNGEFEAAPNDELARQAFVQTPQRTATLVRLALIPASGFASGDFSGAGPITPGDFGEDGVARGIDMRGFEAGTGARNILGHGFLGPGEAQGADEDGEREGNSGARAPFAIVGARGDSRRQLQLQRDLIPRAVARFDAHHTCGSFRGSSGGGRSVEGKHHPDARPRLAGFVALHADAVARDVQRVGGLHAHAQRAAPADARRKF